MSAETCLPLMSMFVTALIMQAKNDILFRLTNKIASRLVHRHRAMLGHLNLRGCCNLTQGSLKIIGTFMVTS